MSRKTYHATFGYLRSGTFRGMLVANTQIAVVSCSAPVSSASVVVVPAGRRMLLHATVAQLRL